MVYDFMPNGPVSETKPLKSLIVIQTLPECEIRLSVTSILLDYTFCTLVCLHLCVFVRVNEVLYCTAACFVIYM